MTVFTMKASNTLVAQSDDYRALSAVVVMLVQRSVSFNYQSGSNRVEVPIWDEELEFDLRLMAVDYEY